jgi:outer membrane protein TolC
LDRFLTECACCQTRSVKGITKLGEAQLKLTVITQISDVNAAYYDLVQQQQQLAALDTTIVISNQRLTLAQKIYHWKSL